MNSKPDVAYRHSHSGRKRPEQSSVDLKAQEARNEDSGP